MFARTLQRRQHQCGEEWQNGREYYAHHGKALQYQPGEKAWLPGAAVLSWDNETRFKA
jgi:hypothetical protein